MIRKKISIMISITMMVIMCLSLCACATKQKEKRQVNSVVRSVAETSTFPKQVPLFKTEDLNGNEITSDYFAQADITVVNFWATFCNPCIDEMPELEKWSEAMPENVQMLGVLVDADSKESDEYATAMQIIEKTNVTYTNILATGAFETFANNIAGVPTTFFVDKEGKVIGKPVVGAKLDSYKKRVDNYLNKNK